MSLHRQLIIRSALLFSLALSACSSSPAAASPAPAQQEPVSSAADPVVSSGRTFSIDADADGIRTRPSDISGEYHAISCYDGDGTEQMLNGEILYLNPDGSGVFQIDGEEFPMTWNYDPDGSFSFTEESGDQFRGKYYSQMISGTYSNQYSYLFTSDAGLYEALNAESITPEPSVPYSPAPSLTAASGTTKVYTMQTLHEPVYGIRLANALVPYGWNASASAEWGICSTIYPALGHIRMISPDGTAVIELSSPMAFLQMARNGTWIPEGTYLDFYNIFLNYRNAGAFNDYLLGLFGVRGTVLNRQGPSYEYQLELNGAANQYRSSLTQGTGYPGRHAEGTYEKTSYFITQGAPYEVEIASAVLMGEVAGADMDQILWTVPYSAVFTAYTEEAYNSYHDIFDTVIANSSFSNEFLYVVQRNAEYLNEMKYFYLLDKVYSPTSGDIRSWDSEYTETEQDRFINAWCDVIKEQDEYQTTDGNAIKVPTAFDTVYQDGDLIYMGPQAVAPEGWTQLNKR
ncbi:MAG: hypothetical protein IKS32_08450 [Solobacterium sp.]|nr:hypothetical protein [Solobacterium sp.]